MRRFVVGVMGAGEGATESDLQLALELGRRIAAQGWIVLSGGRNVGVMDAVSRGAKEVEGSLTLGILPGLSAEASPFVDVAIVTGMGQAHNQINVLSSDVIVACGSHGAGTISEIALALKAGKPTILLAADPPARAFFQALGGAIRFASSVDEAITWICDEHNVT